MSSLTQLCSSHPISFMYSLFTHTILLFFPPALLWVPSHNFALFSSHHFYELTHTLMLLFHPNTFISSLTQFGYIFIPRDISHNCFQFFHPNTSHNFALSSHTFMSSLTRLCSFHTPTFMSSLTQFCAFFIPPLIYLTNFFKFSIPTLLWILTKLFPIFLSQHFYKFMSGGMQARMKNITRLVGLCNKVSGMRKLHYFASTYINCKGTPAMEVFFYEFR